MTTEVKTTLVDLKAQIGSAISAGDDAKFSTLMKEYNSRKGEIDKSEAEGLRKEAEKLAGVRETLATTIHKAIRGLNLKADLEAVKAKGFTFTLDVVAIDDNGQDVGTKYKSVSLTVPTVKTRTASTGNGGAGKTKDQYGIGLAEVYEKYATDADKTALAEAEAKDTVAGEKLGKKTNSNAWRVKNDVKKRAIADGTLAPAK